ncbi:phosphoglycerate dehydrogenase [Tessaracoccus lubricantis]|uniref:phosphoglycerate dehydrogenase n=1 Tax=Tessaracoccus lubricantis TaxID=545543 RepID=UPI0031E5A4CB
MGRVLVGPVRFRELCPVACEMLESAGHELILNTSSVPLLREELERFAPSIDAAIVGMDDWDADLIAQASKLKILAKLGVGLDNIDRQAARELGVDVTNAPGGNANAVAELALGLMLAAARQIVTQDRTLHAGGWDRMTGVEITGKTVGLLGFGMTAQNLARRLRGFEVELIAYDPWADPSRAADLQVRLATFDEVVSGCDFLSVHLPHTPETHHIVSREQLVSMRPGSILVNTSRGGVVDEPALYDALVSGVPVAAGIDVWEVEPPSADHPLLSLPNVVGTCHGAADTYEAYDKVGRVTARAINERLAGRKPLNIQN